MVLQATRNSMLKEEVLNLHLLADMAVNVTAATSLPATEGRLESMAIRARPMVATLITVDTLNTVATHTLRVVITEESDM